MLTYKNTSGIDRTELSKHASNIKDYVKYLNDITDQDMYDGMETSILLSQDDALRVETREVTSKMKHPELKYIFVCGIGGSNLGPLAVYEAITSKYDLVSHMYPKIIFIDTVSPMLHKSVRELIDEHVTKPEEFILSVVSKSGSTTETIANADAMYAFLTKKYGNIDERTIITTQRDSKLWHAAIESGLACIDHKNIGGRFSIMSAVGQIPLRLAGLNVDELLDGAAEMCKLCLNKNFDENPALVSALLQYSHFVKDVHINDNFFFDPELESLGKWYRQLMAESLGKEIDTSGDVVYNGLTPSVSIGSTDLHSMVQLYLGGPRDKFTNFVYAQQSAIQVGVSGNTPFSGLVDSIEGKNMADIMDAIYEGVKKAYTKEAIPFMEITLPEISEYTLGQYMQMKMMEIMYLGKLMNVNAFNQPSVELYKKETREILKK